MATLFKLNANLKKNELKLDFAELGNMIWAILSLHHNIYGFISLRNSCFQDLPQHYVVRSAVCSKTFDGKSGGVVEVYLSRPLFGSILTIYLPSCMFVILCQMVGVFQDDYLDMVIAVNATLLLVLATL